MAKEQKKRVAKPFKRTGRSYPEEVKKKIVGEIQSGFLSQRAAERTYQINRKTIDSWIVQFSLLPLKPKVFTGKSMEEPKESAKVQLLLNRLLNCRRHCKEPS